MVGYEALPFSLVGWQDEAPYHVQDIQDQAPVKTFDALERGFSL